MSCEPIELTCEQRRDLFLRGCKKAMECWLNDARIKTPREKLAGAIFSILVLIDGFDGSDGPYPLKDIDWMKSEDDPSRYVDISGDLHDNWGRILAES